MPTFCRDLPRVQREEGIQFRQAAGADSRDGYGSVRHAEQFSALLAAPSGRRQDALLRSVEEAAGSRDR